MRNDQYPTLFWEYKSRFHYLCMLAFQVVACYCTIKISLLMHTRCQLSAPNRQHLGDLGDRGDREGPQGHQGAQGAQGPHGLPGPGLAKNSGNTFAPTEPWTSR